MTDAVEEWEHWTSTPGLDEEGVAAPLDGAISCAAGGAGETASSLLSALLFAYVILALLRIVVVFSRYIGDVIRTHMVRTSLSVSRCTCAHLFFLSLSQSHRLPLRIFHLFARSFLVARTLT